MKILHVENSVEWPKILLNKEDITDASASAGYNARPANRTFMVGVTDSAGTNQGEFSGHSILGRQVKAPLERCHLA